jgi:hypothetical protein
MSLSGYSSCAFSRYFAEYSCSVVTTGRAGLPLAWLTYHVVLSAFHSLTEVAMHGLLLVTSAYFLFRVQAAVYFRGAKGG